jgi:hypothetical protein
MKNSVFRDVAPCLLRTDVSEGRFASNFRVERISELTTTLAVTGQLNHIEKKNLKMEARSSSETSVVTRPTQGNRARYP